MGHIVHAIHRRPEHQEGVRVIIDAYVLGKLIIGALEEGRKVAKNGMSAIARQT